MFAESSKSFKTPFLPKLNNIDTSETKTVSLRLSSILILMNTCRTPRRFMVGCGRCDDWFHGDCVGLDLAKVREMEEEDQMYVCLKCCEEESQKVEPEAPNAAKPEAQTKTDVQHHKPPPKPQPGPSQTLTPAGVRPVRKVSGVPVLCWNAPDLLSVDIWILKVCVFAPPANSSSDINHKQCHGCTRVCCLFTLPLQKVCTWCAVHIFVHIGHSVL